MGRGGGGGGGPWNVGGGGGRKRKTLLMDHTESWKKMTSFSLPSICEVNKQCLFSSAHLGMVS